jgi:hypothetical protein
METREITEQPCRQALPEGVGEENRFCLQRISSAANLVSRTAETNIIRRLYPRDSGAGSNGLSRLLA